MNETMEIILFSYNCCQSLTVTNRNRLHYQQLFRERVPFRGIIAQLYLSQLKSSTQEYMLSIKELLIDEKCSLIVMHIRLDIGMFVDACTSVARAAGEWGDPDPPPPPSLPTLVFVTIVFG